MDNLAEYRARHAMQYNKRVKEERDKEELIASQLAAEQEKRKIMDHAHNLFIKTIDNISIILLVCESASIMQSQLEELNTSLDTHITKFSITKDSEMMKSISSVVLKVFESVNQNGFSKINFNNLQDVSNSKRICATMNNILSKVGIQHEDDTVEVKYDMDCNQDEEIARRLYLEEENRINAMPNVIATAQPSGRPVRRQRAPRPIPTQVLENENEIVPIVPRPRGRPRRRNDQII